MECSLFSKLNIRVDDSKTARIFLYYEYFCDAVKEGNLPYNEADSFCIKLLNEKQSYILTGITLS